MTELERRALLGDRKAQKECTRQGIVLPCPLCKKKVKAYFVERHEEGGKGAVIVVPGKSYVECECGYSVAGFGENTAIEIHNKRPRPPVGSCYDCSHYFQCECLKIYDDGNCSMDARQERKPEDFCSYFKPRNEEIDYDRT